MTISAIFRGGVFQPIGPVKLREGEKVQIESLRSEPLVSSVILSLKGVWKHATLPTDTDDWVATAISNLRQESGSKLENIAQELNENLGRG